MSQYMQTLLKPWMPEMESVRIIPYFYDPPAEEPSTLPESPNLFAGGRLTRVKGFDKLLEALAGLDVPYALKIAGDGEERKNLEDLAQRLNINVEFLGYVPNDQLNQWYQWSRATVFPSVYPEPFGIVGLEAMGAARPVVGFDVGGVSDWLDDGVTGYLTPVGKIEELQDRIRRLLLDYDLAVDLGQNGRKQLLEKFSSRRHIDALEKTYQELSTALRKKVPR